MKTTVLINNCYGGFCLADEARDFFIRKGYTEDEASLMQHGDCPRHLPILIEAFDKFGCKFFASIEKREIEDTLYCISEYDGLEEIHTSSDYYSVHDLTWQK